METTGKNKDSILVLGNGKLAFSVAVCLLQAGHPITLFTKDKQSALKSINIHFRDLSRITSTVHKRGLEIANTLNDKPDYKLTIAITDEDLLEKKAVIHQLEEVLPLDSAIAINTESIPLSTLQDGSKNPGRIIGTNWVEPAHTTYFLELITNSNTNIMLANYVLHLAKSSWNKDPYIIHNDLGIRAKMFAAMIREAFYLVKNEYASVEDIDTSCRNDAGYYLPFSGNFRYMDLMGTYGYGMVMKDLNPELSEEENLPDFFKDIIAEGGLGMENNKGFYKYEKGDAEEWSAVFRKFSYQIHEIICKYPFNYKDEELTQNNLIKLGLYE